MMAGSANPYRTVNSAAPMSHRVADTIVSFHGARSVAMRSSCVASRSSMDQRSVRRTHVVPQSTPISTARSA